MTFPRKNKGLRAGMIFDIERVMTNTTGSLKDRIIEVEREEIINALRKCNWVMAKAARILGISERMIGYKIRKYGLRIKEVRWIEDSGGAEQDEKQQKQNS